jgi:Domain of unknown function (DUF1707)
VEGRLSLDEFSQRVERALAARTRDELKAVTADLPVPSTMPSPAPATPAVPSRRLASAVRWSVAIMGASSARAAGGSPSARGRYR